jgi:hypothetical protein
MSKVTMSDKSTTFNCNENQSSETIAQAVNSGIHLQSALQFINFLHLLTHSIQMLTQFADF